MSSPIPHDFGSDNHAGAHPEVIEAIAAANDGYSDAYGEDHVTERVEALFRRHFGDGARAYGVFNGTAANVLALDALTPRPWDAVICPETAHINVDEGGAIERFAGIKLLLVTTQDGKLRPEDLGRWEDRRGDEHHVQPAAVSISQSTEVGTVYSIEEVRALADAAHELGMRLHMDGARIANAAAALGCGLGEITNGAGVDVLSFGATKNGGVVGDAVVFLSGDAGEDFIYRRKQAMQLASKMRFVSAQFEALLGEGDLWRRNAEHANAMAARLGEAVSAIEGVTLAMPVSANAVFATLPEAAVERLLAGMPGKHPFHRWTGGGAGLVRWMCSWATTEADVDEFAERVAAAVAEA